MSKMPRRPILSESSLLAAIFAPKKNPIPRGLRKRSLVGTKGRKAARLRSYNAMSALNQKLLQESGQREAYLRGESTIAEAKRILRNRAVDLKIVKPLRGARESQSRTVPMAPTRRSRVINHLWQQLTGSTTKGKVNIATIRKGTMRMTDQMLDDALEMGSTEIKNAGKNPDYRIESPSGEVFNPFWYH